MTLHRPRASEFVFLSPFLDEPPKRHNRRRRPCWPGILLAFLLGLVIGWLLRGGGAFLP